MASSAGEIFGKEVFDNTISLVAMQFDDTKIATSEVSNFVLETVFDLVSDFEPC